MFHINLKEGEGEVEGGDDVCDKSHSSARDGYLDWTMVIFRNNALYPFVSVTSTDSIYNIYFFFFLSLFLNSKDIPYFNLMPLWTVGCTRLIFQV